MLSFTDTSVFGAIHSTSIGCTLKQLSTSVSVNSDIYLLRHSAARQVSSTINLHFSPIVLFVFVLFMKVRQLYSGKDEASLAFLRVEVTGFM